jgi:dTDP-4-dehydrorhamnose reductase
MKTIVVTGGNGRFASELKKIKVKYNFIFLNKNHLDILKTHR